MKEPLLPSSAGPGGGTSSANHQTSAPGWRRRRIAQLFGPFELVVLLVFFISVYGPHHSGDFWKDHATR